MEVKAKPGKNGRVFRPIIASCSDFILGKTTGRWSSFFLFLTLCGMWRNKANHRTSFPSLFKWVFSLLPHRKTYSCLVEDTQFILSLFSPLARILGSGRIHVLKHSEAIFKMPENNYYRFCRKTRRWLCFFLGSLRMTWVDRWQG